ncbi:MAG: hypothetical protein JWP92_3708 [Caulobacter sp.]|nr:hypothetical protein [Caulobacter sp.]
MTAARQIPLFAPSGDRNPTRAPLLPPHATPEEMARKREVVIHLTREARQQGWVTRPNSTPFDAMAAFLPRFGRDAGSVQAVQGASPQDIEIRLTQQAAGEGPLHILAIVTEGLTFDEVRKALAALKREGC